jgi:predicted SAM-dependent methyltransferase
VTPPLARLRRDLRAAASLARRWPAIRGHARPALDALLREGEWAAAHAAGVEQAGALARTGPVRLELGSSDFRRPGWISIDAGEGAQLRLDLRRGLPFPTASVEEIHSEHFFEHLRYPGELMPLLEECHRVLVTGGVISFSVPNVRPYAERYVQGDLDWLKERVYDRPDGGAYDETPLDVLAWFMLREGEHATLFDGENACRRLERAGFGAVRTREFDPARDYNERASSVYVEGRRA